LRRNSQVRAAGIDMPIIALTATVDQDELKNEGILDAGFTDVTSKPLKKDIAREILVKHGHTLPLDKPKPPPKSQPKSQPTTTAAPASVSPPVALDADPAAGGSKKLVLVVEDNPTSQKIIQRLLERVGPGRYRYPDGARHVIQRILNLRFLRYMELSAVRLVQPVSRLGDKAPVR